MATPREMQLRLLYSLIKPVVRGAARFSIPIRTLVELVRLAYFEVLAQEGLSPSRIAERFGQTPRHMRSLARRLESEFFLAEKEVGLVRQVEEHVARSTPTESDLVRDLSAWPAAEVRSAIDVLLSEQRIERAPDGTHHLGRRYVVLASEQFHHRIDALNHFLDGAFRAVIQRIVFDEKQTAMIKTITFSAMAPELRAFLDGLEGDLRRSLASLDESAAFVGRSGERYTMSLTLARSE